MPPEPAPREPLPTTAQAAASHEPLRPDVCEAPPTPPRTSARPEAEPCAPARSQSPEPSVASAASRNHTPNPPPPRQPECSPSPSSSSGSARAAGRAAWPSLVEHVEATFAAVKERAQAAAETPSNSAVHSIVLTAYVFVLAVAACALMALICYLTALSAVRPLCAAPLLAAGLEFARTTSCRSRLKNVGCSQEVGVVLLYTGLGPRRDTLQESAEALVAYLHNPTVSSFVLHSIASVCNAVALWYVLGTLWTAASWVLQNAAVATMYAYANPVFVALPLVMACACFVGPAARQMPVPPVRSWSQCFLLLV